MRDIVANASTCKLASAGASVGGPEGSDDGSTSGDATVAVAGWNATEVAEGVGSGARAFALAATGGQHQKQEPQHHGTTATDACALSVPPGP